MAADSDRAGRARRPARAPVRGGVRSGIGLPPRANTAALAPCNGIEKGSTCGRNPQPRGTNERQNVPAGSPGDKETLDATSIVAPPTLHGGSTPAIESGSQPDRAATAGDRHTYRRSTWSVQ